MHRCTLLGLLSTIALASFAIAVPSVITENTRLRTIIFFIIVGVKGFITFVNYLSCFLLQSYNTKICFTPTPTAKRQFRGLKHPL